MNEHCIELVSLAVHSIDTVFESRCHIVESLCQHADFVSAFDRNYIFKLTL